MTLDVFAYTEMIFNDYSVYFVTASAQRIVLKVHRAT